MIDMYNFERALKVSWIKRLMYQQKFLWNQLFDETYKNTDAFFKNLVPSSAIKSDTK